MMFGPIGIVAPESWTQQSGINPDATRLGRRRQQHQQETNRNICLCSNCETEGRYHEAIVNGKLIVQRRVKIVHL